jgi:hypothetical protein
MAPNLTTRPLSEQGRAEPWERASRSAEARDRDSLTAAGRGHDRAAWLYGLRARAIARTRGRAQTDSVELITEGRVGG